MGNRVSTAAAYDNKDVITQIYGMMNTIDTSTYKSVNVAREGNSIVFTFTTNDDVAHAFTVSDPGISDVTSSQSGNVVTVSFVFTDGSTKSITFNTADGFVTLAGTSGTDQVIQNGGLQIANGDVVASGELEGSSLHVSEDEGAASVEVNTDGGTVVSSSGRMFFKAEGTSNNDFVIGDSGCIANSLSISTGGSVSTPSMSATGSATVPTVEKTDSSTNAASTAFVNAFASAVDGTTNNLVHTNGAESISGAKTFMNTITCKSSVNYANGFISKSELADNTVTPTSEVSFPSISFYDKNGVRMGWLRYDVETDGNRILKFFITASDGTLHSTVLASYKG